MVYVKEPDGYVRQGRHGKSLVLQGNQKDKSKMYCGYFTRYGNYHSHHSVHSYH